jgi:hypothetical protein
VPLDPQQKIEYFGVIYKSLAHVGYEQPELATRAIASLRLLLIDTVGEDRQRVLVGQWNEEAGGG